MSEIRFDELLSTILECHEKSLPYEDEMINKARDYVAHLEQENARLREAQRWIPVGEGLPEDVCGGASTYVDVVYANFDEEIGEIGSQYYRKITQYWHKYGLWEYEYNRGPKSFEEYGYKVIFWKNRTPIPEPPEVS
jgi:hypothetical protein